MKAFRFALGSFLFVAFFASASMAQAQRTFVSGLGSDSNPCSRPAPCRTFGQAIMGTAAGGEVIVLDSAGYGPVTITQSISITAPPGVYAGISVFSGNGITITAGASDTVILRGMTVNNQGTTGSGVSFTTGGTLHIESCVINGFSTGGNGLSFVGPGTLEVKDSIFRNNTNAISVTGTAVAAIDEVRLEGSSGRGVIAQDGSKVTVRNSLASDSGDAGFKALSQTSAGAELNIESCVASDNSSGVVAQSNSTGVATVRISNSTVTHNGTGLVNQGSPAILVSRVNNTVEGNTNNTSGTIGSYAAK
jgi:hypothetical protein